MGIGSEFQGQRVVFGGAAGTLHQLSLHLITNLATASLQHPPILLAEGLHDARD